MIKETGIYDLDGDQVTLRPQKSMIQRYSKRNGKNELGKLLKTEDRDLEVVKYRFTFHYFSDAKEPKLVLQVDSPTRRDGEFSDDKTYRNAWCFEDMYLDNNQIKPKTQKF